jgi:hypothetical protein
MGPNMYFLNKRGEFTSRPAHTDNNLSFSLTGLGVISGKTRLEFFLPKIHKGKVTNQVCRFSRLKTVSRKRGISAAIARENMPSIDLPYGIYFKPHLRLYLHAISRAGQEIHPC